MAASTAPCMPPAALSDDSMSSHVTPESGLGQRPLPTRTDETSAEARPTKRLKTAASPMLERDDLVRRHPLGIKPLGNAFAATIDSKSRAGMFARWPDELLLHFLEGLQVPHLLRLGGTCKALHAFSRSEELWRAIFIESSPSSFTWQDTWRSTFLSQPSSREPRVNCSNLFSDVLHRPFYCAHVSLSHYALDIPPVNQIERLFDLSVDQYEAAWFDKPFILTSPVKTWPVYRSWSLSYLLDKYASLRFRAESVDWLLSTYVDYMNTNRDEAPLYLFDSEFVEKMRLSPGKDYTPPSCFGTDLFSVLGEQRPDHRWLIIGPARSGSTFHKDPNATNAWNAVITGSKYWIMFPSSTNLPPPPGVYVSADQSEVTSPLSIAEWLLGFHAQARKTPGCREGICHKGEVLHVPSGWYHLVLNLEPSIAITQNFVPRARVGAVLHFLREQKQSISGFRTDVSDAYELFIQSLREADPEALKEGMEELERLVSGSRGKWEKLKDTDDGDKEGGFSFGFGDEAEDDEE